MKKAPYRGPKNLKAQKSPEDKVLNHRGENFWRFYLNTPLQIGFFIFVYIRARPPTMTDRPGWAVHKRSGERRETSHRCTLHHTQCPPT